MHGHDTGSAAASDRGARAISIPAANSNLHQVFRVAVRQADVVHVTMITMRVCRALVSRPEPRGGMHTLVHVLLLNVDMPIDVDDTDIALNMWRDPAHIGETEAVITATDYWEYARSVDVRDCFRDLTERFFNIPWYDENVAGIAEVKFLIEVDPSVKPVTVIECRDPADCLRTKARAGPVCGRGVKWGTDKRGLVLADLADILTVRCLHKRIYAGESWLVPATEQRNRSVAYELGSFQTKLQASLYFLV